MSITRRTLPILRLAVPALALVAAAAATDAPSLPDWWPEDVPMPATAEVISVDHAEDHGLPTVELRMPAAETDREAILEPYRAALEAREWKLSEIRDTGVSRSLTATKEEIDKRVIVTVHRPGTIFNRERDSFRIEVTVYRTIPGRG